MNQCIRHAVAIVAALLIPVLSYAESEVKSGPNVDPEVLEFLEGPSIDENQTIPLLIVYHKSELSNTCTVEWMTPSQVAEQLKKEIEREQHAALGYNTTPEGAPEPLTVWIAHGTLAHLTRAQLETLLNNPRIKDIKWTGRKSRLNGYYNPPASQVEQAPTKRPSIGQYFVETPHIALAGQEPYTWGTQNAGVASVRQMLPGILGLGVRVGIIDTGIDPNHPDLAGKVLRFHDFTPNGRSTPYDDEGHGTHVAGTIAGGDTSGTAIGVAPSVQLVIAKAFDADGGSTDDSLIRAMQWMTDPDGNPATDDYPNVINNSWGSDMEYGNKSPSDSIFCQITDTWGAMGIIPVASSGNEGPDQRTVSVPGACPNVITVGAIDQDNHIAKFSSRGSAKWQNIEYIKPDISAPGVKIYSSFPAGRYMTISGTSMAAPHVTGALALIVQVRPGISPRDARRAMMAGGTDRGPQGKDFDYGFGTMDIYKSLQSMF